MSVEINYKNNSSKRNLSNNVLFVDEKFSIKNLKKHISNNEYLFVSDLLKTKDLKKEILDFDISSKRKIILVSFKKGLKNFEAEKLGAKFYDLFKNLKVNEYNVNSDTISSKFKNTIGFFLHGLRLKSYKFEKYKSKKIKKILSVNVIGKNIPSKINQVKFKALVYL